MTPQDRHLLQQTKLYATETRWLSWWHLLFTLAILLAALAGVCWFDPWPVKCALGVFAGLVMVRLFIIYHDFMHGAILRKSRVARLILHVYGLLVLNPPSIWSRSHDHHHRHVGKTYGASIGSYPVMSHEGYASASRGERWAYAASRHPLTIALGYLTIFVYGMCIRSLLADPKRHWDSAVALVLHAVLVAALISYSPSLLLFAVVIPMTVACALGAYLFYAQHNYPGVKILPREEWSFCQAALETSSFIAMGPIARWFTGNIGYHHVHHLNACIPFYRLREAMDGIPELQVPASTTLWPHDVLRCLRLKLWDPATGELTAWRAAPSAS